jgi:hypothetical protein
VGHGLEPADDEEHGELRRAASGPQAAALEPCAPWRLDTLRRHFGSSRLEELAGRVNEPDERRRLMALMEANGDVETAQAILESAGEAHGLDHEVTARGAGIASEALCTAVIQGEASDVRQQLEACGGSAALKLVTEEGSVTEDGDWDLLRVASVEGHTHILRMLVDAGAEPERLQAHTGRTPLFSAAYAGQAEAVCWLHRDCHADLSAPDDSAASPLWAAAKEGHASVVKYLLQHGADLPTRNRIKALELVVVIVGNLIKSSDNPKYRTLKTTSAGVKKVLAAGFEHVLLQAGFERQGDALVVTQDVEPRILSRLKSRTEWQKQRLAPRSGLVSGAPEGARVVRGPDWEWGEQDGGGVGTIIGGRGYDTQYIPSLYDTQYIPSLYDTQYIPSLYDTQYIPLPVRCTAGLFPYCLPCTV